MYSSILLPIDLNHPASWTKALPSAVALAKLGNGELHVLVIVPELGMSYVSTYFPEGFEKTVLARAQTDADAFVDEHGPKDVKCEVHLAHGHVPDQILKTAQEVKADLIVMASHPPDQMRELLVGSSANRVVRHSPVSVMVVRGEP